MKTNIVPDGAGRIKACADLLASSTEEWRDIEGEDNKILVKAGTAFAKQMLDGDMLLFPYSSGDGKEYLVCIKEQR